MKKIKYSLFIMISMIIGCVSVYAAPSYSFSVSSSTIENGSKVTASVTVNNTAAWSLKISSAGNTNGCTQSWADATSNGNDTKKTFSVTCKANSVGSIAFTLSGDITSSDGTNKSVSGSKSVNVKAKAPDSTVNSLKSLSVEGYEISPAFSEDVLDYSVIVPSTVEKVTINAAKKDSSSSVAGAGELAVTEGSNKFDIIVTAESGSTRTYTIDVNVEDVNPIEVNVDGEKYTIVKTSKSLEIPSLYGETTMDMDGTPIPIFVNETTGITLIALKNADGIVSFFMYEDGKYTKYVELNGGNLLVYPTKDEISFKNWKSVNIDIDGNEVAAYKYGEIDRYYLISGINLEDGTKHNYIYDNVDKTFQVFNEALFNSMNNDIDLFFYILLGSCGLIFLCIIIIITLLSSRNKLKKAILSRVEKLSRVEDLKEKDEKETNDISDEEDKEVVNDTVSEEEDANKLDSEEEPRKLSKKELKALKKEEKKRLKEEKEEEKTEEENTKVEEDTETYNILEDD